MKKYSKPELFFENYSLLGSIANGCQNILNAADISHCSADIPGMDPVFTTLVETCAYTDFDEKTCAGGGAIDVLTLSGS